MSDAASSLHDIARPRTLFAAWCVAMLLFVGTAIQTLVTMSQDLYTGIALIPGESQLLITDIGPAGTAWLSAALVVLAGAGLWLHGQLGGKVCRTATLLVGLGVLVAMVRIPLWSPAHYQDLRVLTAWIASACVALSLAHLVQHETIRRWIVAGLLALAVPLLADAAHYVFVQHARTVAEFEANRAAIFQRLNITPGSAQASLYERRMRFADATGAFGLSNVFGAILAALTMLGLGHVAVAVRDRQWRAAWLPAGMFVVAGFTLWLTRSRGAIVALLICLPIVSIALLSWKLPRLRRLVPVGAMAVVLVAILAVLVRGWMGAPDSEAGERSLLFRYQYWTASADIYAAAPPLDKLIGVGPAGFADAYLVHKDPLNPEEIQSAHNIFVDWLTLLGIGGAAWSAVVLLWLWRSAAGAARAQEEPEPGVVVRGLEIDPRDLLGAAAVGVLLMGWKAWLHWPRMTTEMILIWVVAAGGFVLVQALAVTPGVVRRRAAGISLFAAAIALLVHSQIDMAFFTSGAHAFAWMLLGIAGATGVARQSSADEAAAPSRPRIWPVASGVVGVVVAAALAWFAAVPLTQQDRNLYDAAWHANQQPPQWLDAIAVLQKETSTQRTDPATYRQLVGMQLQVAQQFAGKRDAVSTKQWIDAAEATLDRARAVGLTDASLIRAEAGRLTYMGDVYNDMPSLARAAAEYEALLKRTPYSMLDHERLADLYWRLDEKDKARAVYRRILELNEQSYLDAARQLSPQTLRMIEQRLIEP